MLSREETTAAATSAAFSRRRVSQAAVSHARIRFHSGDGRIGAGPYLFFWIRARNRGVVKSLSEP